MLPELKKTTEQKMNKSLEALRVDLTKIRTGRAHTGLLDHVMVDYYGTPTPINQIAGVNLIDGRNLSVQPWEKTMLDKIEKAIRESGLGLNPATQGDLIRVPLPLLTEERRRELVKLVRHEGETARVAVRNLRRDANTSLKASLKNKEISEDDERRAQDEVQRLTDHFVSEIDGLLAQKESEVMSV